MKALKANMINTRSILLLGLFILSLSAEDEKPIDFSQTTPEDLGIKGEMKYFYGPPKISDEQHSSWTMPKEFKCDGCVAVAYQFTKHFALEEERRSKKGSTLSEIQVVDVADKLCSKGLRKYGARTVKGKVRISGEGLRAMYEPGLTGIGPGWKERMQGICKEIVGDVEETEIYDMYRNKGETMLAELLCKRYCTKDQMLQTKMDQEVINEYHSHEAKKNKADDDLTDVS